MFAQSKVLNVTSYIPCLNDYPVDDRTIKSNSLWSVLFAVSTLNIITVLWIPHNSGDWGTQHFTFSALVR